MITFSCSSCSVSITVVDDLRGRAARCPACNHVVTVPTGASPETSPSPLIPRRSGADGKRDVIQRAWRDLPVAELGRRMVHCLLGGLLAQRRQLIASQLSGSEQLASLEARLAQVHHRYRQRIRELELCVEARDAEIARLRRQKAALQREQQVMEAGVAERSRASLRDAGILLRA